MVYVDGFVIPIAKKNLPKYWKMARVGAKVWRDHGALDYKECVADDLQPALPDTPPLPGFPGMCKLKPGETVVFSYILFRNRKHRDQVNARVMKDPRITESMQGAMPMDMNRMAYAGFKVVVDLGGRKAK